MYSQQTNENKLEEQQLLLPSIPKANSSEHIQVNPQPIISSEGFQINIISSEKVDSPKNNEPIEQINYQLAIASPENTEKENKNLEQQQDQQNQQQNVVKDFDITQLIPAYDPFKPVDPPRGRTSQKRPSKFISQSFFADDPTDLLPTEPEQQAGIQPLLLPELPRQRSCLKKSGKFTRSAKKKMSRSFFGRPLNSQRLKLDQSDNNLMENINIDSLKSSFKVNFNQKVRVERVESFKEFNVLEDELKKKIVRNSRFAQQETQQAQYQRSKQPSMVQAFAGGSADDKICCLIF